MSAAPSAPPPAGAAGAALNPLAAQLANDPAVQAAAKQVAMQQGQELGDRASKAIGANIREYVSRVLVRPNLFPCGEVWTCSPADPVVHFERWNILLCQIHIVALPVYLVVELIISILTLKIFSIVGILTGTLAGSAIGILSAYLGFFCVGEQNPCCGNMGNAVWGWFYLLLGIGFMAADSFIHRICYGILIIPSIYLFICCWKLGGNEGTKQCCNACFNMIKGDKAAVVPGAPGAAPQVGLVQVQAVPPST